MPFARVRDKSTRHEFSVEESAVDEAIHERVSRQGAEASGPGDYPLPAKHKALTATAEATTSEKESR